VKLTEEEMALAEKWISRLDKDARARRGYRWSHLVLTLLSICAVVLWFWFASIAFRRCWLDGELWLGDTVTPESVQLNIKAHSTDMAVVLVSFGMAVFFMCVSASMIAQTVRAWRTWPRDLLIAKILRAKLDEEREKAALAGDGGASSEADED